jgi:hypothetical protein
MFFHEVASGLPDEPDKFDTAILLDAMVESVKREQAFVEVFEGVIGRRESASMDVTVCFCKGMFWLGEYKFASGKLFAEVTYSSSLG